MLSNKDFQNIINMTPLVALDIIIRFNNKILLGKRINEPAKGYYFIPGGRILKNESLEKACLRLTKKELGFEFKRNVSNAVNDLIDNFTNGNLKNTFDDKWLNIEVLKKNQEKLVLYDTN